MVLISFISYLPATKCGYVWDDDCYVYNNSTIRSLEGLRQIWFHIGATFQYYPLVHTTYWVEYHLWDLNPAGYHVTNIVLHAISVVLLWRVLLLLNIPGAFIAAAIFAIHPVQVESVAWITERKNVLAGLCYLGAALAYLRYEGGQKIQTKCNFSKGFYVISLLLFLLALFSKTVTCTLPAVLLMVLWWKHGRISHKEVWPLLPFFVLGVMLGLVTIWMEKHVVGATGKEWELSFVERILLAGRALCFYVWKLSWPRELTFIYPLWNINSAIWQQYLYPLAVICVVILFWHARRKIGFGPAIACMFFIITLFPALGFFSVYPMQYSYVADHFQYLAMIGPVSLVASAAAATVNRLAGIFKSTGMIVAFCALAILATLTWRQTYIYKDLKTLWGDTLAKNPDCWMAYNNLGVILQTEGKSDEALIHFRQSVELKHSEPFHNFNLGLALYHQGKYDDAIKYLNKALEVSPHWPKAHYSLGLVYAAQGKYELAIENYIEALRFKPHYTDALKKLAIALEKQGNIEQAAEQWNNVLSIEPCDPGAHYNLGLLMAQCGKYDDAIKYFIEALRLKPDWPEAYYCLGLVYHRQSKYDLAIQNYREALRIKPDFLEARKNLDIVLSEQGKTNEVIK